MDDWRHRILGGLRQPKILLVCLSPSYFASPYCRWEWDEYLLRQVHQLCMFDRVHRRRLQGSDERLDWGCINASEVGRMSVLRSTTFCFLKLPQRALLFHIAFDTQHHPAG